ncbi:MAG: acetylornithine deacetylase [Gemmatimonadales bacterium]|nr:N-formyl-4-amino-5-aminomethyl-2-methylpyrimidine deformylase [bacterium HR33]GIW53315.1 MAG: acetylornithine deacetylase [Gemmatimonadales bacterium]
MSAAEVDREFVLSVLRDLVRINSVNPALDPEGPGEREAAQYVAKLLQDAGLEVYSHEPQPGRVSVVGRLKGIKPGPSLMLNGHLDTVGVQGMSEPFSGRVEQGKLYGRGSYDMKGGVAACVGAAAALAQAGAPFCGELLVAAVADEEHASLGTADLLSKYRPNAAIVTEPTHLEVCLAHKGFAWIEVETAGKAAHGSRPDLGVDANLAMGLFLSRLKGLEQELRSRPPHHLVGTPSLHVGVLRGGTAPSVYADSCKAIIERRTVPGETETEILEEIRELLGRLQSEDPSFRAEVKTLLVRDPFEADPNSPIVSAVAKAAEQTLGKPASFCGQTPWMDSALLARAGIDTVVIGPAGAGAHAAEEWVDAESVVQLSRILIQAALEYSGAA